MLIYMIFKLIESTYVQTIFNAAYYIYLCSSISFFDSTDFYGYSWLLRSGSTTHLVSFWIITLQCLQLVIFSLSETRMSGGSTPELACSRLRVSSSCRHAMPGSWLLPCLWSPMHSSSSSFRSSPTWSWTPAPTVSMTWTDSPPSRRCSGLSSRLSGIYFSCSYQISQQSIIFISL